MSSYSKHFVRVDKGVQVDISSTPTPPEQLWHPLVNTSAHIKSARDTRFAGLLPAVHCSVLLVSPLAGAPARCLYIEHDSVSPPHAVPQHGVAHTQLHVGFVPFALGFSLRALLIDLSGTLHVSDTATPGAAAAIRRLREAGIALRWVSNTSKESSEGRPLSVKLCRVAG